jgi:hypothetical protein
MSNDGQKMPYAKPAIERVNLVGEEMAQTTANCKRAFPPGGGGKNRTAPTVCRITGGSGGLCRDTHGS